MERREAIHLEATRRTVAAVDTLTKSSQRLEVSTKWLLGLTFALFSLTIVLIVIAATN